MTVDCRTCVNWYDDFLEMKPEPARKDRLFYGCAVFGFIENYRAMTDCPRYEPVGEPFVTCRSCGIPVPRVCVLLGECVNCTDTDLFCLRQCCGGELRTYCTHWVRLSTEGRAGVTEGEADREYAADPAAKSAGPRGTLREIYRRHVKRQARRPRGRKAGR
jgi:hypothetical protein